MKVQVKVFGRLKKYLSSDSEEIEVEIDQQSDLLDLLELLEIPTAELEFNLVLVNGVNVQKQEQLKEGDVVSLVPLADGG
ncbi:MoaD/ThiS family protein [Fuchsiella alkaliacetigena]|uniref:MoaD/ThiS family protein n=1 Tax=Fuchsiella alkaliacetigena TaxID=957042 RepID=UPI00200A9D50|nr:MoaD/ThiS family protein [Fuchsiella alkaliacetigena]MCK8824201.1 MoaD/ThiS family protein [Fuchsiella alkaliacetigena]